MGHFGYNCAVIPHHVCFCFSGAEVREVDLKAVTGGIVHTKLWVVDQKHFYLGSANMDWRSLSQVKRREMCIFKCIRISGGMAQDSAVIMFNPRHPLQSEEEVHYCPLTDYITVQ